MRKFLRLISVALLLCVTAILAVGCGQENPTPVPPADGEAVNEFTEYRLEKDYVYLTNRGLFDGNRKDYTFQSPYYAMTMNASTASIDGLSSLKYGREYTPHSFAIEDGVSTAFGVSVGGGEFSLAPVENVYGGRSGARVVESGRYMQHIDMPTLKFNGLNGVYGNLEVEAMQRRIVITAELYAFSSPFNGAVNFALNGGDRLATDGNRVILTGKNGNFDLTCDGRIDSSNGTAIFKKDINIAVGERESLKIIITPTAAEQPVLADEVTVTAEQITPLEGSRAVAFKEDYGQYSVDLTGAYSYTGADFADEAKRKSLERVKLTITNNTDRKITLPLKFYKQKQYFNVAGFSPMLRDGDTLEPLGKQIQISKNWHTYSAAELSENHPERKYEGYWYNGYTEVELQPNETRNIEYTCAYHEWGGAKAASHAQLSLVGFKTGALWDESALGAYGEAFCYGISNEGTTFVSDVRGLEIASPDFNNDKYNFSGNVGGADFLNYVTDGDKQPLTDIYVNYRTQAPNLTDVRYSAKSADGKINMYTKVNLGRTDDASRVYYTFKYDFLEDVDGSDLGLFQMISNYERKTFTKYATGNIDGVTESGSVAEKLAGLPETGVVKRTAGDHPWFTVFDSTDAGQNASLVMIIKDYKASVNGKTYTDAYFREMPIEGWQKGDTETPLQLSYQITAPTEKGNIIKAGSSVEFTVEYTVLPKDIKDYHGTSEYLQLEAKKLNTFEQGILAAYGNAVTIKANKGELIGEYPFMIVADGERGEVCNFTLTGGLGYTPVQICGLKSVKGIELQIKQNGKWVGVGQSVYGNDYFQVFFDGYNGSYIASFNVKNSFLNDYRRTNEYRVVIN